MNLSFNKINEITKSPNVAFKGLKGEMDATNTERFQFTPPPHKHDEKVSLELVLLEKDHKTGLFQPAKNQGTIEIDLRDDEPTTLPQENFDKNQAFAYRYKIKDANGNVRYYNDESKAVDLAGIKGKMNIINQGSNFSYGVSPKGGSMYHAFVDSNAKVAKEGTRSHFNKLGGTLRDIIDLLKDGSFDPYTYLMLNPDIGADRISSHKYWPENQYQCTNMDDFKELNRELFKRGKSYVADGAFTSQGLNSPLVQHVFKWGEASPFYDMLKVNGTDGNVRFGVLPDRTPDDKVDVYENLGVRLVNSPKDKENYDKTKPTYIQFFDKRLLSEEKQNDTKNLYFDYDTEPKDHYDTVKHQDSILPLAFEVDTTKFKDKIDQFDGKPFLMFNQIENLDRFLTFDKVSITTKNNSAGVVNWDGNVDIVKMNTSNPEVGKEQGCIDARDYLLGVATFWTETVQKDLLLTTALMDDTKKADVAKKNGIDPIRFAEITGAIKKGTFNSRILSQGLGADHYIKEFALQSIETAPELSAVFSEPRFNDEFLSTKVGSQTVGELLNDIVETTIDNAIPKEYQGNKDYKTYVTKMYASDIVKNVIAGAMSEEVVNDKNGKLDLVKLKDVNIRTFIKNPNTPDEERKAVIKGISKGIDAKSAAGIQKQITADLKKISLDDFKVSESIVLQGKGGLNWRFDAAKDIGDLDAIRNGEADFKEIWNGEYGVVPFWREFIGKIREHNPSSYVINEITNLADFYDWQNEESIRKYAGEEAVERFRILKEQGVNENYKLNIAYETEKEYLAETNSSTTSMFDEGFNQFSMFVGVDPETGQLTNSGSIVNLMNQMRDLQKYSQPNNSIFAHSFTQNHDKPTLLHALPLDMGLFYLGTMSKARNPIYKQVAKNVTGGRTDYDHISSKAVAVGYMLKQGIKENVPEEYHEKMFAALENLVNGKRNKNDKNDFNRAEAFATLPYELSLKDIIEDAGLKGKIDPLELQFNILKDAREQQMAMTRTSNAVPGVYTLFNGAEFGQTGFETPNKNVHVDNRNRVLRELANNKLFAPYFKETQANLGLYKEQGMSALGGGFSRSLNIQKVTIDNSDEMEYAIHNQENFDKFKEQISKAIKDSTDWPKGQECRVHPDVLFTTLDEAQGNDFAKLANETLGISLDDIKEFKAEYPALKEYFTKADEITLEMAPVFAYDEKGSRTLVIATNNGLPALKDIGGTTVQVKTQKQEYDFPSISLLDKETNTVPLEDGTVLKRKVYDAASGRYVDEKAEYIVKNGQLMKKSAVGKPKLDDNDYININDTTAVFYVPKEGQKYKYLSSLYNGTK